MYCTVYNYICESIIIQFNIFYQIKKTDTGIERESPPATSSPATSSVVGRGHFVQTRLNFSPEGLSLTVMKVITYTLIKLTKFS